MLLLKTIWIALSVTLIINGENPKTNAVKHGEFGTYMESVDDLLEYLRSQVVDEALISIPEYDKKQLSGFIQKLERMGIAVHVTVNTFGLQEKEKTISRFGVYHVLTYAPRIFNETDLFLKRCMDMNDRALRNIVIGLGGKINGVPREDGFIITVASEVMAILCLAKDMNDLKERLGNILIAYTYAGEPVYARDIKAEGAMAALLRDAVNPNLVQTIEGTPAIMHGGPFANIAHGCNSVRATRLALKLADYCITEAGFGSDLGAEKFMDIKCRMAGLAPSCVVVVATVRALKYNGGVPKAELSAENVPALEKGIVNLKAHVENMQKFGVPVVVAINRFGTDTDAELAVIDRCCQELGVSYALSEVFAKGGEGGVELAQTICRVIEENEGKSHFAPIYPIEATVEEKITAIAQKIYGAKGVSFTAAAQKSLKDIKALGGDSMPVCIAKTQYSLSDNAKLLGRPTDFTITIRDLRLSNGAGFVVAYAGDIMTMPGLPKVPAAEKIDVDENAVIHGLF